MTSESQTTHRKLDGRIELEEATNTVIQLAQRQLRIFDYNLSDGSYNSAARFDLLRNFLLASRANRLDIVLHDTDYLTRQCPRMMLLIQQFSDAIRVNTTTPETKSIYDPFLVADQMHYVHRFHYDSPRALMALYDAPGALAMYRRYDEIWEASMPSTFATTLGL